MLVEDNEINQEVAKEFLRLGHFRVDLASNGVECLEKLKTNQYDCVLMDIHMPEMDGYEATRQIREQAEHIDLPILAMTANVMAEDVQQALAAGMNAHIPKPVVPNVLYSTLLEWVPHGEREFDEQALDSPDGLIIQLPNKITGCDLNRALLNVNGNRALLDRLLRDVVSDHAGDLDRLASSVALGKQNEAIRITHSLKTVFADVFDVLKPGAYCCVIVMDLRKKSRFFPFHSDLAARMTELGFIFDDLIIWNRQSEYNNLRPLGYPAVFRVNKVHEFIVLLQKPRAK